MDLEESPHLIFEIGSATSRFGLAVEADAGPKCVFPSVVGRPRHRGVMVGMGRKDSYVGEEAFTKRGILSLKGPVERGLVVNWDDFEKLLHQGFYNEVRVAPEEHAQMMVLPPRTMLDKNGREKAVQIVMETFVAPALQVASSAAMAAHGAFVRDAIILDLGACTSTAAQVQAGKALLKEAVTADCGGYDVVQKLLTSMGLAVASESSTFPEAGSGKLSFNEFRWANEVKERSCHVAESARAADTFSGSSLNLVAPDGRAIVLGPEQVAAPELIFRTNDPKALPWPAMRVLLAGRTDSGSPISKLPRDIFVLIVRAARRRGVEELVMDVAQTARARGRTGLPLVLAGGSSLFSGLERRLKRDLGLYISEITARPNRQHLSWTGAAWVATDDQLQQNWWTKDQYDEVGPSGMPYRFDVI